MIFVTVGTQLPFERFIKAIDLWAKENSNQKVFAQIGETEYIPQHMEWTRFIDPIDYEKKMSETTLIISHAGMGTIITSLLKEKPLLIMPRLAKYNEHRNDHQLATANRFKKKGLCVAYDEPDLINKLNNFDKVQTNLKISPYASDSLINGIRNFIFE